jgi:hypothetical protein
MAEQLSHYIEGFHYQRRPDWLDQVPSEEESLLEAGRALSAYQAQLAELAHALLVVESHADDDAQPLLVAGFVRAPAPTSPALTPQFIAVLERFPVGESGAPLAPLVEEYPRPILPTACALKRLAWAPGAAEGAGGRAAEVKRMMEWLKSTLGVRYTRPLPPGAAIQPPGWLPPGSA